MKLNEFLFIVFAFFLIIFGPFFVIWSFNTLFPVLAIPYSVEVWLAVAVLSIFLQTNLRIK